MSNSLPLPHSNFRIHSLDEVSSEIFNSINSYLTTCNVLPQSPRFITYFNNYLEKISEEINYLLNENRSEKDICLWLNTILPIVERLLNMQGHPHLLDEGQVNPKIEQMFKSHTTYFELNDKFMKPIIEKLHLKKELEQSSTALDNDTNSSLAPTFKL